MNKIRTCKFIEGSFLPAFDGASQRFSRGLMALADNSIKPLAVHCYRGWSDLDLIAQQNFRTIALPAKFYYQDFTILSMIFNSFKPQLFEVNDLELGLSMGLKLLKAFDAAMVFDAQFVSSELVSSYTNQAAELKEVQSMEKKLGKIISGVSCFTQKDRSILIKSMNLNPSEVDVIPMGADLEKIKYRQLKKTDNVILFLGNMYYQPNQEAVEYLAENIIPKLEKIYPKLIFRFVGDSPLELKRKFQKQNVVFTGRIPDINEAFVSARLCLSPILTGGGMRTKTLTYMASGVPVLSTEVGVVGIDHQNSVYVTNSNHEQFCKAVVKLLGDFKLSQSLGKKARKVVEKFYTWKSFAKKYRNFYLKSLQNKKESKDVKAIKVKKNPFWLEELIVKGRFKESIGDDNHIYLLGHNFYERVAINDQKLKKKVSDFLTAD
jgi:glycosyltransferase involved in cell wall biosynthesis